MPIIKSEIINQIPQLDGRIDVIERHTYASGAVQDINYLADAGLNLQTVADLRAANINADINRRELERLAANNFQPPITVREFLDKLTPQERKDLRALAKTNADLEDAMDYLYAGSEVFKAAAQTWLNGLVPAVFTQARVDSILGSW